MTTRCTSDGIRKKSIAFKADKLQKIQFRLKLCVIDPKPINQRIDERIFTNRQKIFRELSLQKNKEFIGFDLTAFIIIVVQLIYCAIRKAFKK
jgi:hypothetical protein